MNKDFYGILLTVDNGFEGSIAIPVKNNVEISLNFDHCFEKDETKSIKSINRFYLKLFVKDANKEKWVNKTFLLKNKIKCEMDDNFIYCPTLDVLLKVIEFAKKM